MSKETAEVLKKAKALIDAPEKWTREAFSRDADGKEANVSGKPPVCFCVLGAIAKVTGVMEEYAENTDAAGAIVEALDIKEDQIPEFNDRESTTHADVMAAFDRAIATESATTAAGAE